MDGAGRHCLAGRDQIIAWSGKLSVTKFGGLNVRDAIGRAPRNHPHLGSLTSSARFKLHSDIDRNKSPANPTTRREFLKNTGRLAVGTALAGVAIPQVYAAENNLTQIVLIGCGGRGTGAAMNALSVQQVPLKLVAMADVFQNRLDASYDRLKGSAIGAKVDVPAERKFIGFDAYQKAMDCLKPGDIAILDRKSTRLNSSHLVIPYAVF